MSFTIALFDDGLQLVPSSWIFDDESMCHWPPYMNEKKIRKAIIEKTSPQCTWTAHKVLRVFGTSITYESGIAKVKLAQDYSDVDISDIDMSRQERPARQKKTFKNDNFVYSSASDDSDQNNNTVPEDQQVNEKIKILPTPPPLPKSFIVHTPTNKEIIQSEELYPNKNMNKEPFSISLDTPGKNTLPEILRRLNQIFAKLSSIDDRLYKLEQNQNDIKKYKEMSVLEEFVNLPLKSNEEIQNMENDLENHEFFEQMAISLNKIGGRNSHELLKNILKRAMTNELARQYSWAGKLKKTAFKDLLLSKCILRAVRITDNTMTENEIIQYISKWLVQATLRHERNQANKTKKQRTQESENKKAKPATEDNNQ